MTTAEEYNENGRMMLHMSYPYVDICTAPYIYYASFNAFECFKMHCNVSQ